MKPEDKIQNSRLYRTELCYCIVYNTMNLLDNLEIQGNRILLQNKYVSIPLTTHSH